jgi:hypothetical protein
VLVAQGKLQEAYQQALTIAKALAEKDKAKSGLQRNLIVSLYKVAITMAKIEGNEKAVQVQELVREALRLADNCPGPNRPQLIDALNQANYNRYLEI